MSVSWALYCMQIHLSLNALCGGRLTDRTSGLSRRKKNMKLSGFKRISGRAEFPLDGVSETGDEAEVSWVH